MKRNDFGFLYDENCLGRFNVLFQQMRRETYTDVSMDEDDFSSLSATDESIQVSYTGVKAGEYPILFTASETSGQERSSALCIYILSIPGSPRHSSRRKRISRLYTATLCQLLSRTSENTVRRWKSASTTMKDINASYMHTIIFSMTR